MRISKGPWPRGERPFIFAGEFLGDPVPGAFERNGRHFSPPDAAWIFGNAGLACVRQTEGWLRSTASGPDTLYAYQHEGVQFLATRDWAILADEMGLGKTVQALTAAELRAGSVTGPAVLILCPALAKRHWAREVKRWTGHDAVILDGLAAGAPPTARYIIANYDILYGQRRKDAAGKLHDSDHLPGWGKTLAALEIPIVICDEAHMLRGSDSRRTKAVKAVASKSTCVWLLTGTPMPNHVRDLWALWDLCSDGLAGKYWPWAKAYAGAYKGQYGWVADGRSRLEELSARLSFFVLARSKAQVGLQLPEKRRELVQVDVGPIVPVPTYDIALPREKTNAVASALRATARAKRAAVTEMAREALEGGQKVVVFVYLREQADEIARELAKTGVVSLATGQASPEQRDVLATGFREHDGPCAFVATIDAVGVAISLVGADLVIFGDLSW